MYILQDATPHVGLDPACRPTLLPVLKQGSDIAWVERLESATMSVLSLIVKPDL